MTNSYEKLSEKVHVSAKVTTDYCKRHNIEDSKDNIEKQCVRNTNACRILRTLVTEV